MAGHCKVEVGAVVALDHNYAQVCPIRVMKVQKDPHATLLAAINSQPRKAKNKSFISNMLSDQGETLEEDDLVEYYSQVCDKMFSTDGKDGAHYAHEADHLRARASTSFSLDYDSFESNNGDSVHSFRPSSAPPQDNMNNLNLLANCGVEQNSKEFSSTYESNPSASPHSSKDSGDFDDSKTESDYQVLAAANALLQLSGNDTSAETHRLSPEGLHKRLSPYDQVVREDDWNTPTYSQNNHSFYSHTSTSDFYQYKRLKAGPPNMYTIKANQIKKNYLYSFTKADKDTKRKKKKRKYKKSGKNQGALDDDDSLDGDMVFPTITYKPCSHLAASHNPWGQALPTDILLKIFQYVVDDTGVAPFLCRVSKVCRLWYTAAADPLLWRHVDLSGERIKKLKRSFVWLCKNRLSHATHLNLTNWEAISGKEIQVLARHCHSLQSVSLSRCSKLNSSALRGLIDSCAGLHELDLSYTSTVITSRYMLEYLVEARGPQLTSLSLATNILVKFDVVLLSIMDKCAMLEVLDLSNVVFSNCLLPLHVQRLQAGCPRLRVLLLTNSLFKLKKPDPSLEAKAAGGFAELETLSVARSAVSRISKFRYVNDDVLSRMLKSSSKLTSLDISGCRHVTNAGLQNLPAEHLTSLNLSHCPLVNHADIKHSIAKWSHSMENLDLGGNSMEPEFLRWLLENCPLLESLTLTGCRGLPWHVRREYTRATLPDLAHSLQNWHDQAS